MYKGLIKRCHTIILYSISIFHALIYGFNEISTKTINKNYNTFFGNMT